MSKPESSPNPEESNERTPTAEEVHAVLRELVRGECQETRKLEDEKGLYVLEVEIPGEVEGEVTEYAYMRKGKYTGGDMFNTDPVIHDTAIHVTYFVNGLALSGKRVARYENGSWTVV